MFAFQNIVVFLIVLAAAGYVAYAFWGKARSATKKGDCGNDCGCGKN